jgi:DNA-binding MarR family transcriptional regulator
MSAAALHEPTPVLRAERGGLAPTASPPAKMHPSAIPLTLSADVLRLKCTMNARAVLAEIVSFHAATGLCDASDSHFAARLSISLDTVSRAVKELEAEGLVHKVTTRVEKILYRTLAPKHEAIAEKAAANPYPQNQGTGTRNLRVGYPQNQGTGTRNLPLGVPAKSVGNTPYNIPSNIPVNPTPSADASEAREEKKMEGDSSAQLPAEVLEIVPPVARPPRAKPAKPGEPEHFADFWQAWPKKEARADAVKAFAKLSPDDQAAAASRADTWLTARPDLADPTRYRFIPHATTWLNQARWTDQAPTFSQATSHVNPTATPASPAPRPVGGQKPSGDAAHVVAESLMRRRFAKPVSD